MTDERMEAVRILLMEIQRNVTKTREDLHMARLSLVYCTETMNQAIALIDSLQEEDCSLPSHRKLARPTGDSVP